MHVGMAGPLVVGTLKHWTGNYTASVLVLAAVMAGGAVFAYLILPVISPDALLKAIPEVAVPPKYSAAEGRPGESDGLTSSRRDPPPMHTQSVQLTRLPSC